MGSERSDCSEGITFNLDDICVPTRLVPPGSDQPLQGFTGTFIVDNLVTEVL